MMSYAEVAAKGPKQTAEEAAAPALPYLSTEDTTTTTEATTPSVHTISSTDLASSQASASAREGPIPSSSPDPNVTTSSFADLAASTEPHHSHSHNHHHSGSSKKRHAKEAAKKIANYGDGTPLALANLSLVVGFSAVLGFKAWDLYERGQLGWKELGIGAGIVGVVGAAEAVIGRYLYEEHLKKK
ncbi:hypothetical protein SAPIO_CDS1584 [Scedosporium apiospermum]|uniref:Uncharacterized protein n=1 Tax=Pseudallescheria apiosperma TaxID=563466 RepID=A0A084GEL5_PSEDA|nr:uncharacterized protein SAPIO_CDS1584 [Scedosporium apiospermum]KEZ45777.1 hypothetical protein SAPIO_CDS1584 [Scedosporium apiospermum]